MYNGHLSIEELEELSQQKGPAENQSHLENCQQCRQSLAKCLAISAKLEKLASVRIGAANGMNCPDPTVWFEVAAGTLSPEETARYVQHAADCPSCGPKLRTATRLFAEDVTSEEEKAISALPSSREENQREIAERLSKLHDNARQPTSDEPLRKVIPWWMRFLRPAYALPALLILVVAIASTPELIGAYRQKKARDSVRNAYLQDRRMPYRPAVAPYGENRSEMGKAPFLSSISIPDSKKEPCLAAEAELWEGDYESAIAILRAARDKSPQVLNDLVVAYARKGEDTSNQSFYLIALDTSKQIGSQDATVQFNRTVIYNQLAESAKDAKTWKQYQLESCKALQQLAELEPSSLWTQEAKSKWPCQK